jgi:methylglutaconyl-CoA hydratase
MRPLLPYLLSGMEFDAVTARNLGLVSRVVDVVEDGAVDALLVELGQGAPQAQVAVKRLARSMTGGDVGGSISEMTSVSAALFAGAEAAEGMAAFAERRAHAWVVGRERTS